MAGEKSVILSLLGNNLGAKKAIEETDKDVEDLKAKSGEIFIGANTGEADEATLRLKDALTQYKVAADEAAAAQERLTALQDSGKASDAELAAAQKEVTDTARAQRAAQLELGQAELACGNEAAVAAAKEKELAINQREAGDAAVVAGDKAKESGAKQAESGAMAEKSWSAAKWGILGFGVAAGIGIKQAMSFNQEMMHLHTQAGASVQEMNVLSKGVLNLAGVVGENPDSLAESAYHVASNMLSMGATTTQILSAVKIAAEGARVGGADLVDVTNALGAAIASGIPGVQNYQQAMGALNATVGAGDMKMQDLAEALGTGFLSNVKIYGSTLNDVGSILATFGDNNIRGAHAGTQLRMSVQSLAVQAKTAGPYLQQLGLGIGELGKYQSLHGTVATIDLLSQKLKDAGIPATEYGNIITQLFGKKAGAGIAVLIDQVDRLDSKSKVLKEGANSFGAAWAAQSNTVAQQWANLKAGGDALAITLGESLLPAALHVLKGLNSFVQAIQHGSVAATGFIAIVGVVLVGVVLKKLEEGVKGAVEGFETLGKSVVKVGKFIGEQVGKVYSWITAQEAETVAAEEVGTANEEAAVKSETSWLGSIASQIGAGIMWVASNTAKIAIVVAENVAGAAVTAGAWLMANAAMMLGIGALVALIAIAVYEIVTHWHTIVHAIEVAWDACFKFVKMVLVGAFDFIKSHWQLILEIILGPIGVAIVMFIKYRGDILRIFEDIYHGVVGFFQAMNRDVIGAVRWLVGGALGLLEGMNRRIVSLFDGAIGWLWNAGVNIIKGLIQGVEAEAGVLWGYVQGIANKVSSVFSWALHILSPSRVFHSHGMNIVLGLVSGINEYAPLAEQAVSRLAQRAVNASGAKFPGAAAYSGNDRTLQLEWVGGIQADQELITWFKKQIRIRGGNPGVLGR